MVFYFLCKYYFKKHFKPCFFTLKTFCSTLNSWIGEFVVSFFFFGFMNRFFFNSSNWEKFVEKIWWIFVKSVYLVPDSLGEIFTDINVTATKQVILSKDFIFILPFFKVNCNGFATSDFWTICCAFDSHDRDISGNS